MTDRFVFRPYYADNYDPNERISFNVQFDLIDDEPFDAIKPMGKLVLQSNYFNLAKDTDRDFVYEMFQEEFIYRLSVHLLNPILTSYLECTTMTDNKLTIQIKNATPDDIKKTMYLLFLIISAQKLPIISYEQMSKCSAPATEEMVIDESEVACENMATTTNEQIVEVPVAPLESSDTDNYFEDEIDYGLTDEPMTEIPQQEPPIDVEEMLLMDSRPPRSMSSTGLGSNSKSSDAQSQRSTSTTRSINRLLGNLNVTPLQRNVLRPSMLNNSQTPKIEEQPQSTPKLEPQTSKPDPNEEPVCANLTSFLQQQYCSELRQAAEKAAVDKQVDTTGDLDEDGNLNTRAATIRALEELFSNRAKREYESDSNQDSDTDDGIILRKRYRLTEGDVDAIVDNIEQIITTTTNWTESADATAPAAGDDIIDSSNITTPREFILGPLDTNINFIDDEYDQEYLNLDENFAEVESALSNLDDGTNFDKQDQKDETELNEIDSVCQRIFNPRRLAAATTSDTSMEIAEPKDIPTRNIPRRRNSKQQRSKSRTVSRSPIKRPIPTAATSSDDGDSTDENACKRRYREIKSFTHQIAFDVNVSTDTDASLQPVRAPLLQLPPLETIAQRTNDGKLVLPYCAATDDDNQTDVMQTVTLGNTARSGVTLRKQRPDRRASPPPDTRKIPRLDSPARE